MAAFVNSVSNLVSSDDPGSTRGDPATLLEGLKLSTRIAKRLDLPDNVVPILRNLSEHFDGSGRPKGLRGEEIPLGARLLSVVDGYLDLTNNAGLSATDVLSEMSKESGRLYDPHLVDSMREFLQLTGQ